MGFGNPYGDEWSPDRVIELTQKLVAMGIKTIALSDTIGISNPESISYLFSNLLPEFTRTQIGAHLHTTPDSWKEKMDAAYSNGCRRFDSVFSGYGGCPMAEDELVGNMPTENLVRYFKEMNFDIGISNEAIKKALDASDRIYGRFE